MSNLIVLDNSFTNSKDNEVINLNLGGTYNSGYLVVEVPSSSKTLPPAVKFTFGINDPDSSEFIPILNRGVVWNQDDGNISYSMSNIPYIYTAVKIDCMDDEGELTNPDGSIIITDPIIIKFLPAPTYWS